MRALRVLLMTLLTSALLCVTAYGAGYALLHQDDDGQRVSLTTAGRLLSNELFARMTA